MKWFRAWITNPDVLSPNYSTFTTNYTRVEKFFSLFLHKCLVGKLESMLLIFSRRFLWILKYLIHKKW
jgi:hypothetical protein